MSSQQAYDLLGESFEQVPGGPYPDRDLAAACGEVRGYVGWHISPRRQETLIASGTGTAQLLLPTLVVHDVTAAHVVAEDGSPSAALDRFRQLTGGRLWRTAGWPVGVDNVLVDADHGLAEFPDELLGVIAERARAIGAGLVRGVQSRSKTVGSVTRYEVYNTTGADWSLAAKGVLERYRLATT